MHTRRLGRTGPEVSAIGYGAMVLEGYYGAVDDTEAIATLRAAPACGVTLIDTADAYGAGHNETLVGRAFHGTQDRMVIATKFGIVYDERSPGTELATGFGITLRVNGRPEYARRCLEASLERLGTDCIGLWQLHFPDPATPIEETVGAMAKEVRAGHVRYLGLCNVTSDQVRRACAVHPIASVQNEFSLWRREDETLLFPTLRELGIGYIPWSPLGAGFFAGTQQVGEDDFRAHNPRFQGEDRAYNARHFAPLADIARRLGIKPAQLALAWILRRGNAIVPIPGSRSAAHVAENAAAADIHLDAATLSALERIAAPGAAHGRTLM